MTNGSLMTVKVLQNAPLEHSVILWTCINSFAANFWGNVLLSAKYILGNVTTEGLAV